MADAEVVPEVTEAQKEARVFGWVPKEEFHGDPEQWRDADQFLQRGREINGFLRKDLEKIRNELQRKDAELGEVKSAVDEFRRFHEQTEERAYKRALKELQDKKKDAIQAGDGDTVIEVEDEIEGLKESRQVKREVRPAADTAAKNIEIFNDWAGENTWFKEDVALQASANGFSDIVKNENPNLVGRAFLDEVAKRVKASFPEKFGNKNRELPSAVEAGGTSRPSSRKKSYADLPAEAKAACDKFVKNGMLTKDQYVADYFSDEA